MHPGSQFLLNSLFVFGGLAIIVFSIGFRRYIRFRWNFGVWQGQLGADRLVREVMKAHVKQMVAASDAREKAVAEFEKCPNLPAPMAARRKAVKKAERKERKLNGHYYRVLCALLKEFMMKSEVEIANERLEIERRELRRNQSNLTVAK